MLRYRAKKSPGPTSEKVVPSAEPIASARLLSSRSALKQ